MMKKMLAMGALALTLLLGGCGIAPHTLTTPTTDGHPLVNLSSSIFLGVNTLTIRAGEAISFREPATGGMHVLVSGTQGTAQRESGAPAELTTGVVLMPGDERTVTFTTPGIYHITALYHDAMQLTVIVV